MGESKKKNDFGLIKTRIGFSEAIGLVVGLGIILPVLTEQVLSGLAGSGWSWEQIPFHSFLESIGSGVGIFVATILLFGARERKGYYYPLAAGFLSMSLFDIVHSWLLPGSQFVWLHTNAVFFGGLLFGLTVLPAKWLKKLGWWLVGAVVLITIGLIGSFYLVPDQLPTMLSGDGFSQPARIINHVGGILFLVAMIKFAFLYRKNGDVASLGFAGLAALFGSSGLLFESSSVWGVGWWWWHFLRLVAYGLVFVNILSFYRRLDKSLTEKNLSLSSSEAELKEALAKVEAAREKTEKLNQYMTGRELRMVELKKKLAELKKEQK